MAVIRLHIPHILTRAAFVATVLGCVTFTAPPAAAEDVYQWRDEAGVLNYGKLPPEGVNAIKIRTNVAGGTRVVDEDRAPAPAGGPELSEEQQEMLADLRRKEDERQQEVTRIRAANCEKARDVLERLTRHGRIKVRDEAGETRMMAEDERQQRIEEAQAGIVANCEATS